jgi:hypothetical protein
VSQPVQFGEDAARGDLSARRRSRGFESALESELTQNSACLLLLLLLLHGWGLSFNHLQCLSKFRHKKRRAGPMASVPLTPRNRAGVTRFSAADYTQLCFVQVMQFLHG